SICKSMPSTTIATNTAAAIHRPVAVSVSSWLDIATNSKSELRTQKLELGSDPLEQRRRTLSPADAHRDDAVPAAAAVELVHQRADQPRAGHPHRMADRYRTAIPSQP